ncbi:MAG: hypothetical protein Q4D51_08365 [Eubacteriales bacterium]|nr:hypothetical protein [Eubacteriales bacterium]
MTDRKLKQLLKNAYCVSETDNGCRFIKMHERRSRQFCDIIKNELRYMGVKSIFAGIFLCALFLATAQKGDENMMWIASSIIPICSIVPMSLIFCSERYGMCELEASTRFSLRFIRIIRMLILGIFSGVVTICGSIFLNSLWKTGMIDIVMYLLFPYFVSVWGGLLVARKWHGKESVIGVPLVCLTTGFLPTIIREFRQVNFVSDSMYVFLVVALLGGIVNESIKYVNERSDLSWNLY